MHDKCLGRQGVSGGQAACGQACGADGRDVGERPAWMTDALGKANHGRMPLPVWRDLEGCFGYDFVAQEAIERHADAIPALLFRGG